MKRALQVILILALAVGTCGMVAVGETYTVASDISWAPFEWADAQDNYYGFDLDVMRCIAILEGYEIDIVNYDWAMIFDDVGIGRVDIGASGATIKPERAAKVDFSEPYWGSDQAVLVRAVADADGVLLPEYNIIEALANGHEVGAQVEVTGAFFIEDLIAAGIDVELAEYPLYPLAVLDLINGNIDAVIQDEQPSRASAAVEDDIMIAGIIMTGEVWGFFVAKGDPNGLLPKINSGVAKLKASGAWDNLVRAYMTPQDPIASVEPAWQASAHLLEAGDVEGFAQSLADLANP